MSSSWCWSFWCWAKACTEDRNRESTRDMNERVKFCSSVIGRLTKSFCLYCRVCFIQTATASSNKGLEDGRDETSFFLLLGWMRLSPDALACKEGTEQQYEPFSPVSVEVGSKNEASFSADECKGWLTAPSSLWSSALDKREANDPKHTASSWEAIIILLLSKQTQFQSTG